jgi:hypothetical protein
MVKFSLSIVSFENSIEELASIINSINLEKLVLDIFIIDNSPTNKLSILGSCLNVIYFHNPSNPGFGASHNIAIQKSIKSGAQYHFVVNPDISFEGDIFTPMINYMKADKTIGMMMPQILNLDGSIQNLPKLLPSPKSVLWRKIKKPFRLYNSFINTYELRTVPKDKIYDVPILSGCFSLLNLNAILEVGVYDDVYFMYFEDWDLSRRMHQKYKTIYFPIVSVYHGYESGANKSKKLFKTYINSAITYFNKWGWFIDPERRNINSRALLQFKEQYKNNMKG